MKNNFEVSVSSFPTSPLLTLLFGIVAVLTEMTNNFARFDDRTWGIGVGGGGGG